MNTPTTRRNHGIDALRILSTFMIVMLHCLGAGGRHGVIRQSSSPHYRVCWFLEILCYVGPNCYALISGCVNIRTHFSISGFIYLWLKMIMYTLVLKCVFILISDSTFKTNVPSFINLLHLKQFSAIVLPISTEMHWYFTAYAGIYFFIPFIHNETTPLQATMSVCILVLFYSVIPSYCGRDIMKTNKGYSSIWLFVLYLIGSCIRRISIKSFWKLVSLLVIYFLSTTLSFLCQIDILKIKWFGSANYTSPVIVLSSISLVLFFYNLSSLPPVWIRATEFMAPLTFGINMLHSYVVGDLVSPLLRNLPSLNHATVILLYILIAVLTILFVGLVDLLCTQLLRILNIKKRLLLMDKLL